MKKLERHTMWFDKIHSAEVCLSSDVDKLEADNRKANDLLREAKKDLEALCFDCQDLIQRETIKKEERRRWRVAEEVLSQVITRIRALIGG
jgi:hypothetical protein